MDVFDTAEQEMGQGQDVFDMAASEMNLSGGDVFDMAEQELGQPSFYEDVVKKTGQDVWEGVKATPETALSLLAGTGNFMTTVPASGLAGLARLITTKTGLSDVPEGSSPLDEAGKTIEGIQGKFAYQPKNETAQRSAELIGKAFTKPGEMAGDAVLKATGSPGLAAGTATAGEIAMLLGLPKATGAMVPKGAPKPPALPEGFKPEPKVFREMQREKIEGHIAESQKAPKDPLLKLKEAEGRIAGKKTMDDVAYTILREEINQGKPKGTVQSMEGKTVGFASSFPKWLQEINKDLKREGKSGIGKKDVNVILNKLEKEKPLTERQKELHARLRDKADRMKGEHPDLVALSDEQYMAQKGFRPEGGRDFPVGDLKKGDEFYGKIEGRKDLYKHKGYDKDGNAIIEDGITKKLDPFDMVKVDGLKEQQQPKLTAPIANERGSIELTGIGAKDAIKNKTISLREYFEDDWVRVKKLTQRPDVKISEKSDPYAAETRYYGRIGARIEKAEKTVRKIDKSLIKASKEAKVPDTELQTDINRYMIAKHAPERNLQLGDRAAGISTKEANQVVGEINSKPYANQVKEISDSMMDLHRQTLDVLLDSEVVSKEMHSNLREKYQNHVPLQRVMEGEDIVDILASRGYDVKGTGLKRAKGSQREVADIMTNIVANHKEAIARAEKNILDQHTLRFARENDYFGGLFEELKPKKIGKKKDGVPIFEEIKDPQVLHVREEGKQVYLKINEPHLATALKGINRAKLTDPFLKGVAGFTRFYSGLMTRYNPEFALSNKLRDLQEVVVYAASKSDVGIKGAGKSLLKDPQSFKDITDHILGRETPGAKLYEQMKMDGGTTGGLGLSTRKAIELDIDAIRKTNRSKPRQAARSVVKYVDNWNALFEDSSRLNVYKQALANGASRKRAAVLAKESSINFNKMGTGGPVVNGLYMFSNASIQGSAKMLRAMKNPKVATAVVTTIGSAVYLVNSFNETKDPEWRNKVTKWDRLNGLNIVLSEPGEDFNYITIPASWGLKPIKVAMEKFYDVATGYEDDPGAVANAIATSVLEGYNPAGGTDIGSALTPTILDVPVDLLRNKKWSGYKIKPDYDPYAPESVKYFDSLRDRPVGQKLIAGTKAAAEHGIEVSPADLHYAYQQYIGGSGRFMDKIITTAGGVKEGDVDVKDVPFASRVYRSIPKDEIRERPKSLENIKRRLTEQSRARFYDRQAKSDLLEKLEGMPQDKAAESFSNIYSQNKDLAKDLTRMKKKGGLDYEESLIKKLGVTNGERAKYLADKFKDMESQKEKSRLYEEYYKDGIITKQVHNQLMFLLNQ